MFTVQGVITSGVDEDADLKSNDDGELTKEAEGREDREEGADGSVRSEGPGVGVVEAEEHGHGGDEEQVDVDELKVGEVGVDIIEDHDGDELGDGVRRPVFEDAEGGDEDGPALPDERRDIGDVRGLRREGRCHARFCLGQRYPSVGRLQYSSTVQ